MCFQVDQQNKSVLRLVQNFTCLRREAPASSSSCRQISLFLAWDCRSPSGSQAVDEEEVEVRAFIVALWEITAQCSGVSPERVREKENLMSFQIFAYFGRFNYNIHYPLNITFKIASLQVHSVFHTEDNLWNVTFRHQYQCFFVHCWTVERHLLTSIAMQTKHMMSKSLCAAWHWTWRNGRVKKSKQSVINDLE